MANFTWLVSQLDSIPSLDVMDKVISVIHYRAQKSYLSSQISEGTPQISEGTPLFTADHYESLSMPKPHESNFTPYQDVTQEMVISWLEELLDVKKIEAILDAQIENFLNPPIQNYGLPWQSNNIS